MLRRCLLSVSLLIISVSSVSALTAAAPTVALNTNVSLPSPLVPLSIPSADDTSQLNHALNNFEARTVPTDFSALESWAKTHAVSSWRAGVLNNLGGLYYANGFFSKAIAAWEEAWKLGEHVIEPRAKVMTDSAIGQLLRMHARLGHVERLKALFAQTSNRQLMGSAAQLATDAREGLWAMENEPGGSFMCGPYALIQVATAVDLSGNARAVLSHAQSGRHGTTLAELNALAERAKLPYTAYFRKPGTPLPLPAVVHWKVDHYAAVVGLADGIYHIKDPTFGDDLWIPEAALDAESSGYFLIPRDKKTEQWRTVSQNELDSIHGMGDTRRSNGDRTKLTDRKECCKPQPGAPPGHGMPQYSYHSMLLSLSIDDTPVGYTPPKGPSVNFTLTYSHREVDRDTYLFANKYTNLGPNWTFNWLSYIQDNPAVATADVRHYERGGGWQSYFGVDPISNTYNRDPTTRAQLVRTSLSPIKYERRLTDGSIEKYEQSDGSTAAPRRIFLTAVIDPAGNTVQLQYDAQSRLTTITDAALKTTTFTYGGGLWNSLTKIKVNDAAAREANITYDSAGKLDRITDAVGLTSTFSYLSGSSFIASLLTPYSTTPTQFAYCDAAGASPGMVCTDPKNVMRRLKITDPTGEIEHAEYRHDAPAVAGTNGVALAGDLDYPPAATDAGVLIPGGMLPTYVPNNSYDGVWNNYLNLRNTFVWNREVSRQLSLSGVDWNAPSNAAYQKAKVVHWIHATLLDGPVGGVTEGVAESERKANESRIWYQYAAQRNSPIGNSYDAANISSAARSGISEQPSRIGRRLPDGSNQITQFFYNEAGKVIRKIDPLGQEWVYEYADNDIDLIAIKQPTGVTLPTVTDSFSNPAWIPNIQSGYGAITVNGATASLTATPVAGALSAFWWSYDTGPMLCRKIPALPTTLTVTMSSPTALYNNQIFTLRTSLDRASPNIQITGGPGTGTFQDSDKFLVNTRWPYGVSANVHINPVSPPDQPPHGNPIIDPPNDKYFTRHQVTSTPFFPGATNMTARFAYDGWKVTSLVSQNGGAFQPIITLPFANLHWVCVTGSSQSTTTSQISNFTDFTMTVPEYRTLETFTYNSQHQPLMHTDALNHTTIYTYNAAGQLLTLTDAAGVKTTWNYNASGQMTSILNTRNEVVAAFTYDPGGRMLTVTDGVNRTVTLAHDALNRITKVTHPDTTFEQFTYDKLDLGSYKDRLTKSTSYAHNALGQLTGVTDALLKNTLIEPCVGCEGFNKLADPNQTLLTGTTITRDEQNKLKTEVSPDRGSRNMTYDTNGNVKTLTDGNGVVTTYTYDANDRVTNVSYAGSANSNNTVNNNLAYTYDVGTGCTTLGAGTVNKLGRLCKIVDGAGETSFTYDIAGRLSQEARLEANQTYTTAYSYDAADRLLSEATPTSTVTLTRDNVGRTNSVTSPLGVSVNAINYNPNDQITSQTFGNGFTEPRAYDLNDRLSTITVPIDPLDTDGDGMPDAWETANGFDLNDPNDANGDADSDGLKNLQEYLAGTNPHITDTDADGLSDGQDPSPTLSTWLVPIIHGYAH